MAPPGHLGNGGGRTSYCHLDVCMYTCMHTVRVNSYIYRSQGGERMVNWPSDRTGCQ